MSDATYIEFFRYKSTIKNDRNIVKARDHYRPRAQERAVVVRLIVEFASNQRRLSFLERDSLF